MADAIDGLLSAAVIGLFWGTIINFVVAIPKGGRQ